MRSTEMYQGRIDDKTQKIFYKPETTSTKDKKYFSFFSCLLTNNHYLKINFQIFQFVNLQNNFKILKLIRKFGNF